MLLHFVVQMRAKSPVSNLPANLDASQRAGMQVTSITFILCPLKVHILLCNSICANLSAAGFVNGGDFLDIQMPNLNGNNNSLPSSPSFPMSPTCPPSSAPPLIPSSPAPSPHMYPTSEQHRPSTVRLSCFVSENL